MRCAGGLLSAYALCLLLLLLALGGLGVHLYPRGASALSAELEVHWGVVQVAAAAMYVMYLSPLQSCLYSCTHTHTYTHTHTHMHTHTHTHTYTHTHMHTAYHILTMH